MVIVNVGLMGSSVVTTRFVLRTPAADGSNVTWKVVLAPAASVELVAGPLVIV